MQTSGFIVKTALARKSPLELTRDARMQHGAAGLRLSSSLRRGFSLPGSAGGDWLKVESDF